MTESERKQFQICATAKQNAFMTIMLFSFKFRCKKFYQSITQRRMQRCRRDVDLDRFSQVLRSTANDNLIAKTSYLYLILCSMGSQCSCLR